MSNFNESNEMASELVFARTYQGNEPTPKPDRLVFVNGDATAVVTAQEVSHEEWADVASTIDRLIRHGYELGCDMDVSWNGRYDIDGDPLPAGRATTCRAANRCRSTSMVVGCVPGMTRPTTRLNGRRRSNAPTAWRNCESG